MSNSFNWKIDTTPIKTNAKFAIFMAISMSYVLFLENAIIACVLLIKLINAIIKIYAPIATKLAITLKTV